MNLSNKFYTVCGTDGFQLIQPEDACYNDFVLSHVSADETHRIPDNVRFKLIRRDRRKVFAESDAPWFMSGAMFLKARSAELLEANFSADVFLEKVACSDESVYMLRPKHILAALDEELSSVNRFDNGEIFHIEKYSLIRSIVASKDIFVLSNLRFGPTLFSHRFVKWWIDMRFKGLDFSLVHEF